MNPKIARATLNVIRKERKRRLASLPDDPLVADDLWPSADEVFVNELCLMLLVAIRHQVERELFSLAARATDDGRTLNYAQYQRRLKKLTGDKRRWEKLVATLNLDTVPEWGPMEVLRLLANCYKHSASQAPQKPLLRKLSLDQARNYASLSESPALREGLARPLKLVEGSDYCDIASEFLTRADCLLSTVRQQQTLSAVKGGRGGARPSNFRC